MPTIKLLRHNRRPTKSKTINRQARQKIYQTKQWQKLRLAKLVESPLCEDCLERGAIVEAIDVHHIVSFMTVEDDVARYNLAFDYNNLRSLCKQCHQKRHNNEQKK